MAIGTAARVSVCLSLALAAGPGTCCADGFRIETKLFVGEEEQPANQMTTLFLNGTVYDFLVNPQQKAVFRSPAGGKPGRFILLSDQHRIRTEISTEKLTGAMNKL